VTTREVPLPRSHPPRIRTRKRRSALLQRLAVHYPDAVIAASSIGKAGPPPGERFTASAVGNLRRYRHIPRCTRPAESPRASW